MEHIKVTIKKGVVTIETDGFVGEACQKATQALSQRLGTTVKDTPTAEMFETAQSQEVEQQQ